MENLWDYCAFDVLFRVVYCLTVSNHSYHFSSHNLSLNACNDRNHKITHNPNPNDLASLATKIPQKDCEKFYVSGFKLMLFPQQATHFFKMPVFILFKNIYVIKKSFTLSKLKSLLEQKKLQAFWTNFVNFSTKCHRLVGDKRRLEAFHSRWKSVGSFRWA